MIEGRIQAFPWPYWREEFSLAEQLSINLIEWTLDQDKLYENPIMTASGQADIQVLCHQHGIDIPSLTGDCFMQAPFWKCRGEENARGRQDFQSVLEACVQVGISMVVVPLVDNGRIEDSGQEQALVEFLEELVPFLRGHRLRVLFESDLGPAVLGFFIGLFDSSLFGINYDIGNSAAAGFSPTEEIETYGHRVLNVHVKDRVLGGTTVPLGFGDADFESVFEALDRVGYDGNYVLQTARASDGDHASAIRLYQEMTSNWMIYRGS